MGTSSSSDLVTVNLTAAIILDQLSSECGPRSQTLTRNGRHVNLRLGLTGKKINVVVMKCL